VASFCGLGWLADRWFRTAPWLLAAGLVLAGARVRYESAWLLPICLTVGAFVAGVLTNDAPYVMRLAMALPGMALLAALPLVALARTSPSSLVRVLTLALPIIVICLVNVKWFFIDYPSEGMGGYETAAVGLLSSANVPAFAGIRRP